MRSQSPNLSVLTDRDCLVTFAAMALCCDNSVRDHEMGYYQGGGTKADAAIVPPERESGDAGERSEPPERRRAETPASEGSRPSGGERESEGSALEAAEQEVH